MNSSIDIASCQPVAHIPEKIHAITLFDYNKMLEQELGCKTDNKIVKRLMITLLKERPTMWKKKEAKFNKDDWANLAKEIYERTDILVNLATLRDMWACAKKVLLRKIRVAVNKNMDHQTKIQHLLTWEYFPYMEWYYATLERYEAKLRGADNSENQESDDEDIQYLGTFPEENEGLDDNGGATIMRVPLVKRETINDYHPSQAIPKRFLEEQHCQHDINSQLSWYLANQVNSRQMPAFSNGMHYYQFPANQETAPMTPMVQEEEMPTSGRDSRRLSNHSSSVTEPSRKRASVDNQVVAAEFFKSEVQRLFEQHPHREGHIRGVVNKTLQALDDDPEQSMEELFSQLAESEKRAREKREQRERRTERGKDMNIH